MALPPGPSNASHTADPWHVAATGLGMYAGLGGLLSFIGWAADLSRLTDWSNGGISIQPNATVAATAAGTGLLALLWGHTRIAAALGALVGAIGASALLQYLTRIDLGIDTLLMFERQWGRGGVLFPGRMGPPGATAWTLIGGALVLASWPLGGRRWRPLVPALALVTTAVSSLSVIGYLHGANALYTIPTATVIAFQTSTFILAVSVGLVLSVREHGPMRLLGEQGPAGVLVRRIVPALVVVPIVLGVLRLEGERAGLFDLAFATAARTILEIALLLGLLFWTAATISRQARAQAHAEATLRQSREQLEADLADSVLLQRVSAEIVRQNDVQSLYEKIVDSAIVVMRAQYASMQLLESDSGSNQAPGLRLLVSRGLSARATAFWECVTTASASGCGQALSTGERIVVPDVLACGVMAGTEDLDVYRETGIRALQSTPLVSRSGTVLGMLSTHWTEPHEPSARELRLLDILARQAADLIERRQNEDALRNADRRKDQFLVTLAHELRNPLAPIRSAVDLLKHKPLADPDLVRARDIIDRQLSQMARLLDDLMDVGRIARDRLELRRQPVDLASAIQAAVEMSAPLVERFQHDLQVALPPEPVVLHADPGRLGQVIGNLLTNACRYTDRGGRIQLRAERQGPDVLVTVSDSGIGIPPGKLASIFEMFSQVDSSLERSQGGLGIGLHLVQRIVEMHGGRVEASSDGVGRGSRFTVRLPIADSAEAPELQRRAPSGMASVPGRRVLVVDDNADAAAMLAMLFGASGHIARVVHDGPGALAAAESFRPDLMLLDIGLPGMNGFDVCQRIRLQPWGRHLVVVALTGWGQEPDRQRSRDAGFDGHLVKPVEHEALLDLLAALPARSATETA